MVKTPNITQHAVMAGVRAGMQARECVGLHARRRTDLAWAALNRVVPPWLAPHVLDLERMTVSGGVGLWLPSISIHPPEAGSPDGEVVLRLVIFVPERRRWTFKRIEAEKQVSVSALEVLGMVHAAQDMLKAQVLHEFGEGLHYREKLVSNPHGSGRKP